jgi:hypothetical protein
MYAAIPITATTATIASIVNDDDFGGTLPSDPLDDSRDAFAEDLRPMTTDLIPIRRPEVVEPSRKIC